MKKILALVAAAVLKVLGALHLNTPNRVVVAFSPLFFSASGVLLVLVARYCPLIGGRLTRDELVSLFIAGATLGSSKILMWLHGWQKSEARVAIRSSLLSATAAPLRTPDPATRAADPATRAVSKADEKQKEELEGAAEVPPPSPGPAETPAHEVGRL